MLRSPSTPPGRQRGEFNLPRLMTICAILVAILLVPLYFLKDKAKARPAGGGAGPASAPAPAPR
jgi:hypothetical protein